MDNNVNYYSSGEFAAKANVSVRTIRYYDKVGVLSPTFINENGKRYYTEKDFITLQQILLLKYLGFSLNEIKQITYAECDNKMLKGQLSVQNSLVIGKIESLQKVQKAIENTIRSIDKKEKIDWQELLQITHESNSEFSIQRQYHDAKNINARIDIHRKYSVNSEGWFEWLFRKCNINSQMDILEVGCGNGELWKRNISVIPKKLNVTLSDISKGMVRDANRQLESNLQFDFKTFPVEKIPFENQSFDLVIANHMLFYCKDIKSAIQEIRRVLRKKGKLVCSTYGPQHMKEINEIVQEFDKRIVLSEDVLFEKFGLENGDRYLQDFSVCEKELYEDELYVTNYEAVIEYILSCHGNQNEFLLQNYAEFKEFVKRKVGEGLKITKQAGIFVAIK